MMMMSELEVEGILIVGRRQTVAEVIGDDLKAR